MADLQVSASSTSEPTTAPVKSAMSNRERFIAACRCIPLDRPPLWMMRQAGRCLPEYRALKENHTFVELVRTPELAAEITLQPIRRFGFDGAVLFSDILVVPEAMGQPYRFREGGGIQMDFAVRSADDIRRLNPKGVAERLKYVADALSIIKPALEGRTALLGFAGSPWTLANYVIDGESGGDSTGPKRLFYAEPRLFEELLQKLTDAVTEFLQLQIDSGVDAIQIFDSNGGALADSAFEAASGKWIRQITSRLAGQVPVILFSKRTNHAGDAFGANVLSVDWTHSLSKVRVGLPENVGVQGNLDPALLTTTPEIVAAETTRILQEMKPFTGHVFNLGHGVPPAAKLECIQAVVDTIHQFA